MTERGIDKEDAWYGIWTVLFIFFFVISAFAASDVFFGSPDSLQRKVCLLLFLGFLLGFLGMLPFMLYFGVRDLWRFLRKGGGIAFLIKLVFLGEMCIYGGSKNGTLVEKAKADAHILSRRMQRTAVQEETPSSSMIAVGAHPLRTVGSLLGEDYEFGLVLARIGTDETFDFSPPQGALVNEELLCLGAVEQWYPHALLNGRPFILGTNTWSTVALMTRGELRPHATDARTFLAPLRAHLEILSASNWDLVPETDRPSQVWTCLTPSNTFVATWQNVFLDENLSRPVSFQVELQENGRALFRYDFSRLSEDAVTNVTVGFLNEGGGCTFDVVPRNVTSLRWERLDLTRVDDPDPDGDGLSTEDEIFLHGTDPYGTDSDRDGLADGEEIALGTDPHNAYSLDVRYIDSVSFVIGDVDPFSCPEGSTNTVWEHVFYTGTTNAPFAYPVADNETAVLEVSVTGTGAGRIVIGDRIIPLLGSDAPSEGEVKLLIPFPKGVTFDASFDLLSTLSLTLDSDDMMIGHLPTASQTHGWLAFPHTDATEPCIHNLSAVSKEVSLIHGEEFPGLTATWSTESEDVDLWNFNACAAWISAAFETKESRELWYTVDHPLTCRFA